MATYSKQYLTGGAADGTGIKLAVDSGTYTTIHTSSGTPSHIDEVWLYASNTDATDRKVSLQFGGTTDPDDIIEVTVGAEAGLVLLVPGLVLKGGSLVLKGAAAVADKVTVFGYVNRIS